MEEQQRNFKGIWIPKEIWLSKELTFQEKIILVEIDSYDDEKNGCWASNKHFVKNFGLTSTRVSQIIQSLLRKKYITIDYEYNGKEITKRFLHINRPPYPKNEGMLKNNIGMSINEIGVCQNLKEGYVKKLKENNTYINNTKNNNKYIVEQLDHVPYKSIVDYMNDRYGTSYKHTTNKTKDLIKSRFNEGFTEEDFKTVIDKMGVEWMNTEMQKYLRPETLFGTKFESYLNREVKQENVFSGIEAKLEDLF